MLTFAMPLMILLDLMCSTKVSVKYDMAKSWAARLCRLTQQELGSAASRVEELLLLRNLEKQIN